MQVRDILTSSAEDLCVSGWDEYFGYCIVDTETAVAATGGGRDGIDDTDTTAPTKVFGLTATAVSTSQMDIHDNQSSIIF